MKKISLLVLLTLFLFSCKNKSDENDKELAYSFFVAGHTYGNKNTGALGLHPPFKSKFPLIQSHDSIKFGVLLGDIVFRCDTLHWDKVDEEVSEFDFPVYFAPGNHDVCKSKYFKARYSNEISGETYFSFYNNNDLFIVLDANIDWWNISGAQLNYVKEVLNTNATDNNVFIFVHQLIWWNKNNEFSKIVPNLPIQSIPDSLNYWTVVEPLLRILPNKVFMFAGDLGATNGTTPFMYYVKNNITYVATGMGNEKDDNFIFISVFKNGEIEFELIALQGKTNRFGKLEEYILP